MGKKATIGVLAGGLVAAAAAATIAFAAPAAAQTSGRAVAADQAADRPAYCDQVEKALDKRQRAMHGSKVDASTRGSIAWLNDKAAAAGAAGTASWPPCTPTGRRCVARCWIR